MQARHVAACLLLLSCLLPGCRSLMACSDAVMSWVAPFTVNTPATADLLGRSVGAADAALLRERIALPPGWQISTYADGLRYPRFLAWTSGGDLLVTQPRQGQVLLLERDSDGDGRADGSRVLLEGLSAVQGIALHEGWLYLGQPKEISRVRFDPERGALAGEREHVATLPMTSHHVRGVRFGPDGWLYTGIGANCNVCESDDPEETSILRMKPDGSEREIFASGIRNAESMAWHPDSGELYAVDACRDLLGDDFPPEELNRIERGAFYGFPYANGARIPDPDFGDVRPDLVSASEVPAHEFAAHTTPLGIRFLRGETLPAEYRDALLVALHGSWNRSEKQGYKVVSLHWDADGEISERDFAAGFELDEDVIGRPVDVVEGSDGAIYLSDDYAGAVYRIHFDAR